MKDWPGTLPRVRLVVPLCLLLFGLGVLSGEWIRYAFEHFDTPVSSSVGHAILQGSFGALLLAVLVVPVLDEVLFRGFLLRALLAAAPIAFAVVVQSVLFAGLHPSVHLLPIAFVLGLLFGLLVIQFGSLPLTMLGHMFWNGHGLVFLALGIQVPGYPIWDASGTTIPQPTWWLGLGGVAIVAGSLGLIREARRPRVKPKPAGP